MSHMTQNRSLRRRSSQPISWPSTEKLKQIQLENIGSRIDMQTHAGYSRR